VRLDVEIHFIHLTFFRFMGELEREAAHMLSSNHKRETTPKPHLNSSSYTRNHVSTPSKRVGSRSSRRSLRGSNMISPESNLVWEEMAKDFKNEGINPRKINLPT